MVRGLGSDTDGESDSDDEDDHHYCTPWLVTALLNERVRTIAAGPYMSCAVTDAGALYTWGCNEYGDLGHGDVRDRDRPTLVQGLQGIRVVSVSVHEKHTLALAADGSVYAIGMGSGLSFGHEGHEDVQSAYNPHKVPGLVCKVPPQ
jgi:alpha-tubulin suppressor-like RCC1 family protein